VGQTGNMRAAINSLQLLQNRARRGGFRLVADARLARVNVCAHQNQPLDRHGIWPPLFHSRERRMLHSIDRLPNPGLYRGLPSIDDTHRISEFLRMNGGEGRAV